VIFSLRATILLNLNMNLKVTRNKKAAFFTISVVCVFGKTSLAFSFHQRSSVRLWTG